MGNGFLSILGNEKNNPFLTGGLLGLGTGILTAYLLKKNYLLFGIGGLMIGGYMKLQWQKAKVVADEKVNEIKK